MKTITNLEGLGKVRKPVCMAAGFFDGVHRGHRAVLLAALDCSRSFGGEAWAMTFDRHPAKLLDPAHAPLQLTYAAHKLRLMEAIGMDGCLMLNFTRRLANLPPDEFVENLMRNAPTLRSVVVGADWRFGRRAAGDSRLLSSMLSGHDISVCVVRGVSWRGAPVSSTRIRDCVARGLLSEACTMLGRPFSILGVVKRGRGVGRRLGFPTANIDAGGEVRPPPGVYAVQADIGGRMVIDGVMNIGSRPTFGAAAADGPSMEVHLPGFAGSLYGRLIEVHFIRRLRDERRFHSPAALAKQIALDIAAARRIVRKQRCKII